LPFSHVLDDRTWRLKARPGLFGYLCWDAMVFVSHKKSSSPVLSKSDLRILGKSNLPILALKVGLAVCSCRYLMALAIILRLDTSTRHHFPRFIQNE